MNLRYRLGPILIALAVFLAALGGGQLAINSQGISSSADLLNSFLGGTAAPILAHMLVGVLACAAFVWAVVQRKIVRVPSQTVSTCLALFVILIVRSIASTDFKFDAITSACEWLSYIVAFFAALTLVGRKNGPATILASLAAACAILALLGVLEYGSQKATSPDWRIFSLYVNPNALGAMLLIGFFCSSALLVTRDRLESLAAGVAGFAIGVALMLTGSKGSLLGLIVGVIVFAALCLTWCKPRETIGRLSRLGLIFVLLVAFAGLMQIQAKSGSGASAISRVTDASATADQSSEFRQLLWKGAFQLARENPLGTGIGSYRNESAKPGLTTQTEFTHNTYLQLLVEASPLAPLLLVGAFGLGIAGAFKGARKMPATQNLLRAGVVAAIAAVGFHSLIDSDLYYYGIGFSTFVLLAVLMLLSTDAVAPENAPKPLRYGAAACASLLGVGLLLLGYEGYQRETARDLIQAQDGAAARQVLDGLQGLAPMDPEVWHLSALAATDPSVATQDLLAAVANGPSTRNLRVLAQVQLDKGDNSAALTSFQRALDLDPNNLLTLYALSQAYAKLGRQDDRVKTLNRLLAVEATPYFQVRSLPDLIPTETYQARVDLAALETDVNQREKLLQGAVDGFERYRKTTLPTIRSMTTAGLAGGYGGETLPRAMSKMEIAAKAADDLAALYGDPSVKAKVADAAAAFRSELSKAK